MKAFLDKHRDKIVGTLSCFDRTIFKGHLRFNYAAGLERFLDYKGILLKDFKAFALKQAERLKSHAHALAQRTGRPLRHFDRPVRKQEEARRIAEKDGVKKGLVCIFTTVEPCNSFQIVRAKRRPRLRLARRKCLFLYYYFNDPRFGLIHLRLQTWFPFTLQVYVNGHEYLARAMDHAGLRYEQLDNCFVWLEDPAASQRLADRMAKCNWPAILGRFARRINPLFADLLAEDSYYWVTEQAELSTDVLFRDRAALQGLYSRLVRHATLSFNARDVLGFLGKKLHHLFKGEVLTDFKERWPGTRVKYSIKNNWLKMYDKFSRVLRIETVINNPYEFKVRRLGRRQGRLVLGWHPMAKRVSNLDRYAVIARSINERFLAALHVVDDPQPAQRALQTIADPVHHKGRFVRGFNPAARKDVALFAAVMRGEHSIRGFRNVDVRHALLGHSRNPREERRRSALVSRLLKRLHVHRLIAKIPRSRRWRSTQRGSGLMSLAIRLHESTYLEALRPAA